MARSLTKGCNQSALVSALGFRSPPVGSPNSFNCEPSWPPKISSVLSPCRTVAMASCQGCSNCLNVHRTDLLVLLARPGARNAECRKPCSSRRPGRQHCMEQRVAPGSNRSQARRTGFSKSSIQRSAQICSLQCRQLARRSADIIANTITMIIRLRSSSS